MSGRTSPATHYYNTLAEIPPDGRMGLFDEVAGWGGSPAAHYCLYAVYAASGFQHNSWNAISRTEHPSALSPSRPNRKAREASTCGRPPALAQQSRPTPTLQIPASALRA